MNSVLPPPRPPIRQAYYSYTIVDTRTAPATPVDVRMTRKECRDLIDAHPDAVAPGKHPYLRTRRGRTTLYQS